MREPFIEVDTKKQPGFNIGVLLLLKTTNVKGKVGIEIEVEGSNLVYAHTIVPTPTPWLYKEDHSLRGAESGEYILKEPIEFKDVSKAVNDLFDAFKKNKTKFDDSNRTSVHVHLNCIDFHLNRLAAFMALWFTFEEILTQWCGEHRVGNLFCLRSRDATAIISHLRKFLKSDGKFELSENLHYAGLNAHALRKFGSLEVRTMRGVSDPKIILNWVEILQRLYEYSAIFDDPRDVCGIFSGLGPMQMFNTVFGNKVITIREGVTWTDDQIRDSLYSGIRLAQDICYCRDWSLYKPQTLKPDPFKRDMKKVAKKVINFEADEAPMSLSSYTEMLNSIDGGNSEGILLTPGQHVVYTNHTQDAWAPSIFSDPFSTQSPN